MGKRLRWEGQEVYRRGCLNLNLGGFKGLGGGVNHFAGYTFFPTELLYMVLSVDCLQPR